MPTPRLPDDLDYALLSQIAEHENTNQRAMAEQLGVSVGKLNYLLRAVVTRGWVKVNNFRRSDNKWAYAYLLTPNGASAKMRMARSFLERKEQEFERLQGEIATLRREIRAGVVNE